MQSLQLSGGATESIFPQVEALLDSDSDYMKALEFVAKRKNMERYQSVIDFLFCELNPDWIRACKKFYAGMGPQLKEVITAEQLLAYNNRLLAALEVAVKLLNEKRQASWVRYLRQVDDATQAA